MIVMNKKFSISKTGIYLLLLVLAIAVYAFAYFIPAQNNMTMIRSEIALHTAETAVFNQYLDDTSALEADIDTILAEIDRLHAEEYTNESDVSFKISSAIQQHRLAVSSVALNNATVVDGNRALPISVEVSGNLENLLEFISYFENNEEGSYRAQGATVAISGSKATATLLIYLCTPSV